jgi:hypothetical protein
MTVNDIGLLRGATVNECWYLVHPSYRRMMPTNYNRRRQDTDGKSRAATPRNFWIRACAAKVDISALIAGILSRCQYLSLKFP